MISERKITILSLVVAVIAIIISTVLGFAALSQSESLAIESGSLKKAKVRAAISDIDLDPNKVHKIIFGAKKEEMDKGLVIAPFTVGVQNYGDKKLENLYVTYRYHKHLKREALEYMSLNVAGAFVDGDFSRKFSSSAIFDYVTFHIPTLNPSVSVGIDEPFVLQETKIYDSVRIENDLDPYTVNYTVDFAIKFQVSISSSLTENQDYNFEVSVIPSEDLNELQSKFTKETIKNEMTEFRNNLSVLEYLGVLLFSNNEREVVLIYPHNQKVGKDNALIFFPNENEVDYRTITYKPALWKMLYK
ncbi:exported hypothetical protein [Vibrio coralliirubri]|uniref:hypothetical protein n=1 Tax=Vibrio coralliirubri TaxID=1516159 RepID=UPI000634A65F|nr:hypothetical protein [Vibrio coralliirubri]CDT97214.1 exported hypothetical protein [Vibrio coralliirubri]